jgi:predicted nucleotidyltransferase
MSKLLSSPQGKALLHNRKKIKELVASYGCSNPACFGSVARGEATNDSDIDLLVDIDQKKFNPERLQNLAVDLERIVGYPFDVATPAFMRDSVRQSAIKEAIRL